MARRAHEQTCIITTCKELQVGLRSSGFHPPYPMQFLVFVSIEKMRLRRPSPLTILLSAQAISGEIRLLDVVKTKKNPQPGQRKATREDMNDASDHWRSLPRPGNIIQFLSSAPCTSPGSRG